MTRHQASAGLTERDRFWLRATLEEPCWVWRGTRHRFGYGLWKTRRNGKTTTWVTHRLAWHYVFGPIPEGMLVLHHCDNPPCVRPDHLYLGTQADNMSDMDRRGRRRSNPPTGANAAHAVLTPETATEMMRLHASGATHKELAARYGVSNGTVYNVVRGKHWAVRQPVEVERWARETRRLDVPGIGEVVEWTAEPRTLPEESALERELRLSREADRRGPSDAF